MTRFASALLIAVGVLWAAAASAQDKSSVAPESQKKLSDLFASLGGAKTCSRVPNSETWECSYRGKGLRQISVRATLFREEAIKADVLTVVSTFATLSDFPNTADFYLRVLKFNADLDFAKLAPLDDGRLVVMTVVPMRLLDKEELVFLLDQVAAANNEAFAVFGKDAKH